MGQALLPEHLVALEESLIADTTRRFDACGLPAYGIARLKWNETLLADGVFSVQEMTLVTPTGMLLVVHGNAVINPFNLNVQGSVSVPIYCHVPQTPMSEEEAQDILDTGGKRNIARVIWKLALSSQQSQADTLETIKIAEFEKSIDGIWKLSGNYIPPFLQIGVTPFLRTELEELQNLLDVFYRKVAQEIAVSYLSRTSIFSAKECLKSIFIVQRFIANCFSQVHRHPFFAYEVLKKLYTDVCFYRDVAPEYITEPYDHDRLVPCFQKILEPLKQQIHLFERKTPYLPFDLENGIYRLAVPADLRGALEVYFLVQKSHVGAKMSIDAVKMASQNRLPVIHQLALLGVPLQKIDRPPFQHRFGPEVEFYRIVEGEEWDLVLRELSLAFYDTPQFQDTRFYLFWRMG
jgi:type VI secretion system protein ImpJ